MRRIGFGILILFLVSCNDLSPQPNTDITPQAQGCSARNNNTYDKLLECVTLNGVRAHQNAFQTIANANNDRVAAPGPDSRDRPAPSCQGECGCGSA
jgi:hypothetical protein